MDFETCLTNRFTLNEGWKRKNEKGCNLKRKLNKRNGNNGRIRPHSLI